MRTELQRLCNEMDREVYGLMIRAEYIADRIKVISPTMRKFAMEARALRPTLRRYMHADDLKGTEG